MSRKDHLLRDLQLREQPHRLLRPSTGLPAAAALALPVVAGAPSRLPARSVLPIAEAVATLGAAEAAQEQERALEAVRRADYERGRQEGLLQGRAEGQREGREAGLREARAELVQEQEAGREEGYREGLRQAQEFAQARIETAAGEAAEQARHEVAEQGAALAQRLEALLSAWPGQYEDYLRQAEDDIVALAFDAACRLLGEQAASAAGLRGHLHQALLAWRSRAPLSVHLHPDDLEILSRDPVVAQGLGAFGPTSAAAGVRWVADPDVAFGGCLLRSADGGLDARLDIQLQTLRDALLRTRAARRAAAALEAPTHGNGGEQGKGTAREAASQSAPATAVQGALAP